MALLKWVGQVGSGGLKLTLPLLLMLFTDGAVFLV